MLFAFFLLLLDLVKAIEDEFDGDEDYTEKFIELQKDVIKGANYTFRNIFFRKINIMLCGISGSGKSYLINHLFRYNFTKSNIGKPVTKDVQNFTKEGSPLTTFDVPGFEHDSKKLKNSYNLIFSTIKKHKTVNVSNSIHCIFYCVSCENKRFEDSEANFIRKLCNDPRRGKIPVFIVLTQCFDEKIRDKMIQIIKDENLGVEEIIPILAGKRVINNNGNQIVFQSYGVSNLIESVGKYLPVVLYEALKTFQYDHRYRKYLARPVILASTAITMKDPKDSNLFDGIISQFAMIYMINYIYGVDLPLEFISNYYKWIIGTYQNPNVPIDGSINFNISINTMINPEKIEMIVKDIIYSNLFLKFLPGVSKMLTQTENSFLNSIDVIIGLATFIHSSGLTPIATFALGESYVRYIEDIYFNYDPNITISDIRNSIEKDFKSRIID